MVTVRTGASVAVTEEAGGWQEEKGEGEEKKGGGEGEGEEEEEEEKHFCVPPSLRFINIYTSRPNTETIPRSQSPCASHRTAVAGKAAVYAA